MDGIKVGVSFFLGPERMSTNWNEKNEKWKIIRNRNRMAQMKETKKNNKKFRKECEPGAKTGAGDWMGKVKGERRTKAAKKRTMRVWRKRRRKERKRRESRKKENKKKGRTMEGPRPCLYSCWQFRATRWASERGGKQCDGTSSRFWMCALLAFTLLLLLLCCIIHPVFAPCCVVLRCVPFCDPFFFLFFLLRWSIVLSLKSSFCPARSSHLPIHPSPHPFCTKKYPLG